VHISSLHGMVNPAQFREMARINQRYFCALKHSNLIVETMQWEKNQVLVMICWNIQEYILSYFAASFSSI
jgi:hypothetical protein